MKPMKDQRGIPTKGIGEIEGGRGVNFKNLLKYDWNKV